MADFKPLEAATLAIASVIFAVVGGFGSPLAGGIAGALWIAAVFDLCRFLSGGKLICLEHNVCVIGRVVQVTEVGADKSGFEKMDDDFTFDVVLSPHSSEESVADLDDDPHQGRFVQRRPGPDSIGLGYDGESVKFGDLPADTEVLHCEVKGCRVHDVCIVLKIMAFPTAGAMILCSIPVIGWLACLIVLAVVALLTLIIGGIVWAATHNGDIHDVMDPDSGLLNAADANSGLGGDIVLMKGDWVYDAGHAGWNEIHPLRFVQKLDISPDFNGSVIADPALVERFKTEVLDPFCFEVGQSEDPLVQEEQAKAENSWRIHPAIDGCGEDETTTEAEPEPVH